MDRSPMQLVESFADSPQRMEAYRALAALGAESLPALRHGLRSKNWRVRHWSAICLDRLADAAALTDLVPLLRDPKVEVRVWAVHSLACDHCKDAVACPVDAVPLLIERIQADPHVRVRRMAVIMLGKEHLDPRAVPVLREALRDPDRKIRLHAAAGLRRYRDAGLDVGGDLPEGD